MGIGRSPCLRRSVPGHDSHHDPPRQALDDDGAVGSIKALRDGLFGAETRRGLARMGLIIPDDSLRYARFEMPVQETGKRFAGREEVEFLIVGENR